MIRTGPLLHLVLGFNGVGEREGEDADDEKHDEVVALGRILLRSREVLYAFHFNRRIGGWSGSDRVLEWGIGQSHLLLKSYIFVGALKFLIRKGTPCYDD